MQSLKEESGPLGAWQGGQVRSGQEGASAVLRWGSLWGYGRSAWTGGMVMPVFLGGVAGGQKGVDKLFGKPCSARQRSQGNHAGGSLSACR